MNRNIKGIINEVSKIPWKNNEYSKQNWGIWLHSISSYVGRIKPSFAHWLIEISTNKSDLVLDPFCGIGTIVLESNLMGRNVIGNDLNPYAYIITKAKFDRNGLQKEIEYLEALNLNSNLVNINKIPDWVKEFYHEKTLIEIITLRDNLLKNNKYFLLGCLLGIVHGHRKQHLSIQTGYIIPYLPNPKPPIEYREVIPRMIQKVKRMYKDDFPESNNSIILNEDCRNLSIKSKTIDVILTSPPYYHTLDYVHTNRLRLWFAGINFEDQKKLTNILIQQRHSYLNEMKLVGNELKRVLKDDGLIVFILGDVHFGKNSLNTAEDISNLYSEIGLETHGIVNDSIPASRTTIVKYGGVNAIKNKKEKLDRILFMTKN